VRRLGIHFRLPASLRPAVALALAFALALARPARAAPQVEARLGAGSVPAGGTVTLLVTVTNPSGGTGDPAFGVPQGLSLLGSDRSQSFSWVNGRSSTVVQFRYEIGADTPGEYSIGPIRVRVGTVDYMSEALPLRVSAASAAPLGGARGGSGAPARLIVEVRPERPWVGQLVQLSMRLVQTSDLADSRAYSAPGTPGFWSESWGDPVEYRAQMGGRAVAVTERRARLYPLAPGIATIGSASLVVAAAPSAVDPFSSLPNPSPRPIEIRSDSVRVAVRALPAGAPPGFGNAVGDFQLSWGLDRGHTAQDQAVTLRLDVRGTGNLPLLHTPPLALPDFEVFASTVDDSFAPSGEIAPGRRRFQWTLLPRRAGALSLVPPAFSWFDPGSAGYRSASLPDLPLEVLSARPSAVSADEGGFPRELGREPAEPGGRGARPWGFALSGLLVGLAVRLARSSMAGDDLAGERAKQREYLRAVGLAHGPDFWRAADEAATWAEERGERVAVLKQDIAVARYGGTGASEDDVRRRLVERVAVALPPAGPRTPRRWLALLIAGVAVALWWLGSPQHGDERLAARARAADTLARERKVDAAGAEWRRLWEEGGGGRPELAARLAWAALSRDRVAEAAVWVLRGRAGEARCGALQWAAGRVREAGGLVGAPPPAWPLRTIEWAALAFALALGAMLEWPRRWSAAALLALSSAAAAAAPFQHASLVRTPIAVVRELVPLAGADLDLDPGQVVTVVRRGGGRVRVRAGRGVEGELPADAVSGVWGGGR
jgi:hypothetical protein